MSTKEQTTSTIMFDMWAGDSYEDGALTSDPCPVAPLDGISSKLQTVATVTFNSLVGDTYTDCALTYSPTADE